MSRQTTCEYDGCFEMTFGIYCYQHDMISNIDYYLQIGRYSSIMQHNRYSTPELIIDDINMSWGPPQPSPVRRQSKNILKTKILQKDHDDNCSICFEAIKIQTTVYDLKCKHLFHTKCLDEWKNHKNTCPLDRSIIE